MCWIELPTLSSNARMPSMAIRARCLPSNVNGLVTTATVKIPLSIHTSATIGAAPVPVPPPIPAVINTICASPIAAAISSRLSSAACRLKDNVIGYKFFPHRTL